MNWRHRWVCGSERWRNGVRTTLVPWVLDGVDLGSSALEIGPGPGASTDVVRQRVGSLTCVEIDPRAADELAQRTAGQNVLVLCQDATSMTFARGTFDSVVCLTMLHHVPSVALQDRLFREVARVLRPGGMFAGADSLASLPLRLFHLFDTLVPIEPAILPERLTRAGFDDVCVDTGAHAFRFRARRRLRSMAAHGDTSALLSDCEATAPAPPA